MNRLVTNGAGHHDKNKQAYFREKPTPETTANGNHIPQNNHGVSSCHQTLNVEEVEFMFREPFINTGYRLPNQSWKYYLSTFLWLHNESWNVWTHAAGCVFIIMRTVFLGIELDGFRNPRFQAVAGFALACLINNFLSSAAHLLHTKSARHHYLLYFMDYAGITIYNLGNAIGSMYLCSHPVVFSQMEGFYLPVVVLLSWLSFVVCVQARLHYKGHFAIRRKVIMMAVFVALGVFVAWPMWGRYAECMESQLCSLSSLNHITIVFIFFILSALCYSLHAPERWWPGCFDIWGHSHQWFHLCVSITQQLQFYAVHVDLVDIQRGEHAFIGLGSIVVAILVLAGAEGLTIAYLNSAVDAKVIEMAQHDGSHEEKKTE